MVSGGRSFEGTGEPMIYTLELAEGQVITRTSNTSRVNDVRDCEGRWNVDRKFFATYWVETHEGSCYVDVFWYSNHRVNMMSSYDHLYAVGPDIGINWGLNNWPVCVRASGVGRLEMAAVTARNDILNGGWWPFLRKQ